MRAGVSSMVGQEPRGGLWNQNVGSTEMVPSPTSRSQRVHFIHLSR